MSETSLFDMEWEGFKRETDLNIDSLSLFREIEQELSKKLLHEGGGEDSTDGPLAFIENLTDNLQAEFGETLGEDGDKKLFIRSLTEIFAILLSTKADSVDKIHRKRCYNSHKIMARAKLTVRRICRLPDFMET